MTTIPRPGRSWEDVQVLAGNYERDLVPALFEPWARELVELADPRPGERVLDVACGTGIVARLAAPRVGGAGTVTGVDVNAEMLAFAREVCADVRPAITWKQASAHDTGLPEGAFDVVLCQQGLQFFRNRPAAVRELRRLTPPGGRVAVSVWCDEDNPGYAPFAAAFERHIPQVPEAVGFVRAIFGLADREALRDLLAGAGFREVEVHRRTGTVRFPSAQTWVDAFLGAAPVPAIGTLDPAVRDEIVRDAVGELQALTSGDGLSFPVAAHVSLARR